MAISRYRVRAPWQSWEDSGPDILRTKANAQRSLLDLMPLGSRFEYRKGEGDWQRATRAEIVDAFKEWRGLDLFVVATLRPITRKRRIVAVADCVKVERVDLGGEESPGTELVWSLIKARFPGVRYGGGYVWKETSPGFWSDHAWGTAVDATENRPEGVTNDAVTAWCSRMAATGNMAFDYALGSQGGRVVQVGSTGSISPSGAADSHLWHVHVSVKDHDGAKPPRTGGVW